MSQAIACIIKCECGGDVEVLPREDGHHIYYVLTSDLTIIFRGTCSQCHEGVRVEREIQTLLMMCPTLSGQAN